MGTLVAKKYPTKLFANAADHVYVECGTGGKAWGCWGGKTGGTECKRGEGSTKRADAIAQPDERAGITCYLINGVCHQAANRILFAAQITLENAGVRGYGLSSSIYGVYGRAGVWPCSSQFEQYPDISGDLPECVTKSPAATLQRQTNSPLLPPSDRERKYIQSVIEAYNRFSSQKTLHFDPTKFHMDLFDRQVKFRLGEDLGNEAKGLHLAKETFELTLQRMVAESTLVKASPSIQIKQINELTLKFQDDIATALNQSQYKALLDLAQDERVVLANPEVIELQYGKEVMEEVFNLKPDAPTPTY